MTQRGKGWRWWMPWWLSVLEGAALGCFFRLLFSGSNPLSKSAWFSGPNAAKAALTMTIAFFVFVPLAMGYVSVNEYLRARKGEAIAWQEWAFMPIISVGLAALAALAVGGEGGICVLFASPVMLFSGSLGGIAARLIRPRRRRRDATLMVALLPLAILMVEAHIPDPREIRTVQTEIRIHATPQLVWNNIKSVRAIAPGELPESWVTRIGFPKPVAATLSHDGVGGVRAASFTAGLVFTETVNRWEPDQDLRFSIRANTDSIPPTTLDEHVKVGGPFFDVLQGEYTIEQTADGVILHLASRERLSTHFNPYAGVWTDAVMRGIQQQILVVIRNRCEERG